MLSSVGPHWVCPAAAADRTTNLRTRNPGPRMHCTPFRRLLAAALVAGVFPACSSAPRASLTRASDDVLRAALAAPTSPRRSDAAATPSSAFGPAGDRGRVGDGLLRHGSEALVGRLPSERSDGEPVRDDVPAVSALQVALKPGSVRWQDPTDEAPAMAGSRYGIETELLQPFIPEVGVITIKATQTLWGDPGASHGDAMLGVFLRPSVSHDVVDTIDEYMASVGYRHYFGKGLHAEVQYLAGYVWGRDNLVDGKDYEGFVQFVEANVGYRFDFNPGSKRGFYVIPQFGYIQGLNEELIIGPRNGKDDTFWQGKLLVGYRF
ncbi:MAG: hypothetical protein ACK595_00045 [Planctomycetota bacterium]|jgi:hypothetical protein